MSERFSFRPARVEDYAFCERLYFESLRWIMEALSLDETRQYENFAAQWRLSEVRIITMGDEDIGWLQTAPVEDALFLKQLYVIGCCRRQGIGGAVMNALIEEAMRLRLAITLAVVKINPAQRLYERLGFRIMHEDEREIYMRRECNRAP
jgi:ribosomal protein S18 acetylase RimI-like enzyme